MPTGIRVGTDALALVKSDLQDNFKGWEVSGDVDFYRYYLTFDYGTWQRTYSADSADYDNDGTYWRVGADVNFLMKDLEKNMFFVGARYARANFNEEMTIIDRDDIWGDFNGTYKNENVNARWLELTTGIRVKIWKFIWMGYTARFKFGLKTDQGGVMLPHDIPGYGRTNKETTWGFNYLVLVRLPVRK